jgi:hypothetical protein
MLAIQYGIEEKFVQKIAILCARIIEKNYVIYSGN